METPEEYELDKAFRAALGRAVGGTDPLTARFLDQAGAAAQMPAVISAQSSLGYWVGMGLEHIESWPSETWRTFLWVSPHDVDGKSFPRPLDLHMTGPSARDPELLASMVVSAILASELRAVR